MGVITGEYELGAPAAEITVDAKDPKEEREPWQIVTLSISTMNVRTPSDLIELGQWLIKVGTEIPMYFTETGKRLSKPRKKSDFKTNSNGANLW